MKQIASDTKDLLDVSPALAEAVLAICNVQIHLAPSSTAPAPGDANSEPLDDLQASHNKPD